MRNPVAPMAQEKELLLNPEFHLRFVQHFGWQPWVEFVSQHPIDPGEYASSIKKVPGAELFLTKNEIDVPVLQQTIAEWTIPDEWTPEKEIKSLGSTILLEAGDGYDEFLDRFQHSIFNRVDIKAVKRVLDDEADWDSEGYPGLDNYQDEAAELLKKYAERHKREFDWYYIAHAMGYRGEPGSFSDLARFLIDGRNEDEENYTAKEEKLRIKFQEALDSGIRDAWAVAQRDGITIGYRNELLDHTFFNSELTWDKKEIWQGKWKITTTFGELLDILYEASKSHRTEKPDPFKYHVSDDALRDHFLESNRIDFDGDYAPDDLDVSNGYDYFSDRMSDNDIFEKGRR